MKRALYCITALLLCSASAFARFGETETECAARYGKPEICKPSEHSTGKCVAYHAGRFLVKAYFLNGRAEALLVNVGSGQPFSKDELDVIMSANSGGAAWLPDDSQNLEGLQAFKRSDGQTTLAVVKGITLLIQSARMKA